MGCVVKVSMPTLCSVPSLCMKWIQKCCSGISRKLRAKDEEAFKCKICVKEARGSNKSQAGMLN